MSKCFGIALSSALGIAGIVGVLNFHAARLSDCTTSTAVAATSSTSIPITADDIAGTGSEIANANKPKIMAPPIEDLVLDLAIAAHSLDLALIAVDGTAEMKELRSQLQALPMMQSQYISARRSGASAEQLREIAKRYARSTRTVLALWENERLRALNEASLNYAKRDFVLHRALSRHKLDIDTPRWVPRVMQWQELDIVRVRVSVYVGIEYRNNLHTKAASGEKIDDSIRERELLKSVVIYLEDQSR